MTLLQSLLQWLNESTSWIEELKGDKVTIMDTTTPTPVTPPSGLDIFCTAIKNHEGAVPANNNPGNCKFYYGGYLPIYGNVKRSVGGFAMFPTYAQGWLYLETLVTEIVKNHPTLTFLQFFGGNGDWDGYAPASDKNNPLNYSTIVSSACRKGINDLVSTVIPVDSGVA